MREGLQKIVSSDETIVALSTPPGRSAIGVIRISGSDALNIAHRLFKSLRPPAHQEIRIGEWRNLNGEILDEVVVTFARAPRSYTGEDVVEISGHGNPMMLNHIVRSILDAGARPAKPGEFTLRAVTNGKMDLMQAEAVSAFVDAQTAEQARTALRQLEGAGAGRIAPVKDALINVVARLEAGIDFAEDDVDVPDNTSIRQLLENVVQSLTTIQETFGYGRMLIDGVRVTILGKPNVGKSSIFNRLLQAERAIVTDVPGTTRDVLSESLSLEGIPLRLMDTAGLRDTDDAVEQIGVRRSRETLVEADLALVVLDGSSPMDANDVQVLSQVEGLPHLLVVNKADLPPRLDVPSNGVAPILVSALTGFGVVALQQSMRDFLMARRTDFADDFVLTSARQNDALNRAIGALKSAIDATKQETPHEMLLLDLYSALEGLNELTGEVVTEDILDRIFSTFCIGK